MTGTRTAVLGFDNSYARELDGAYVSWTPTTSPQPHAVRLNHDLAAELGLPEGWLDSPEALQVLAGNIVPDGAQPLAQAYSGHQFGVFNPILGDGRAVLLGEIIDTRGRRRDIAFKGSGRTPFSRGGDGKAALGPVLREYLMGEAMHALGIPTTRALAAVATGEPVHREGVLPGAVLTRVAASHLRVGTFEFAARRDRDLLRRLADHAIARHDPDLAGSDSPYLGLLRSVVERQAALVARWMGVGFIHGVMNTDNMTISGETIDYGPCAFLEAYDPLTAFSSIDYQGRYAYGNQPAIALWNLTRFAESLGPLVGQDREQVVPQLVAVLDTFDGRYAHHWTAVLRAKLGLDGAQGTDDLANDRALGEEFLDLLARHRVDFTLGWRGLVDTAGAAEGAGAVPDGGEVRLRAIVGDDGAPALADWLSRWRARLRRTDPGTGPDLEAMRRANPAYIPRNHRVEEALTAAVTDADLGPFDRLLAVLADPFTDRERDREFADAAPSDVTATYQTFCGT